MQMIPRNDFNLAVCVDFAREIMWPHYIMLIARARIYEYI